MKENNSMTNIFQGNDLIKQVIAKNLGYNISKNYIGASFTEDIFFSTFFYLSKRFGPPTMFDDGKEAGTWNFKVKNFEIGIRLNSCWVEFMIFGKIGNPEIHSPYIVKLRREWKKKRNNLLSEYGEWNENEKKLSNIWFKDFCLEFKIPNEITQEEFNEKFSYKWYEFICKRNKEILNIDYKEIESKYGNLYQNSYTRYALKTLDKFLKNMLTPIWIRDVSYNIKGQISNDDFKKCCNYENNIKIEIEDEE